MVGRSMKRMTCENTHMHTHILTERSFGFSVIITMIITEPKLFVYVNLSLPNSITGAGAGVYPDSALLAHRNALALYRARWACDSGNGTKRFLPFLRCLPAYGSCHGLDSTRFESERNNRDGRWAVGQRGWRIDDPFGHFSNLASRPLH